MTDAPLIALLAGLAIALQTAPLACVMAWQEQGRANRGLAGAPIHAALLAGLAAAIILEGRGGEVRYYLLGDLLAVSTSQLWWIFIGLIAVGAAMTWLWRPLLAIGVHEDIAAAEGISVRLVRIAYMLLLAFSVAVSIGAAGLLAVLALLTLPSLAARHFATSPEQMLLGGAVISTAAVLAGLGLAAMLYLPAAVAIISLLASFWLAMASRRLRKNRA